MNRIGSNDSDASESRQTMGALPVVDSKPPQVANAPETGKASPPSSNHIARNRLTAIVISVVILCGLAFGFVPRWRQRNLTIHDMRQLDVPAVSIVSPRLQKAGDILMLPAEIRPWREASIFARANGYLKDWVVDIGAHVQAGQLLAEIETPDLDQQLVRAKAQLALSQANLHLAEITDQRWQTLLKTASVSEQAAAEKTAARATAAASVEADRANMRRLQDLVAFQRVIAPFAGTITLRSTDIGDLIIAGSGGKELFHIAQAEKLRVYVRVPEPNALSVSLGQTATLTTPETPGRMFTGKVVTTAEAISPASRTLLTELEVDNSQHQILPYSFGEIKFEDRNTDPILTLPSSALLFRSQGLEVAAVNTNQTIELRPVRVGRDFGQTLEILGGVDSTDRVVSNPTDSLVSGVKVAVESPSNASAMR